MVQPKILSMLMIITMLMMMIITIILFSIDVFIKTFMSYIIRPVSK